MSREPTPKTRKRRSRLERLIEKLDCPNCHGKGYADIEEPWGVNFDCEPCGGHGYNPETVERLAWVILDIPRPFVKVVKREVCEDAKRKAVTVLDVLQEEPE